VRELSAGHRRDLCFVVEGRCHGSVAAEPLERRELAVGEDTEQLDDGCVVLSRLIVRRL
jgi:hypothetical protein